MCRLESGYLAPSRLHLLSCTRGRRVVRKYRRLGLRREVARLRRLLPREVVRRSREQVLRGAVELIQSLEEQLVGRLREAGVPARLAAHLQAGPLDLATLRQAVGGMMEARRLAVQGREGVEAKVVEGMEAKRMRS